MTYIEDNIEEPTAEEIAAEAKPQVHDLFGLLQACELIAKHYNRGFDHLKFTPAMQIIDGCVGEFTDVDSKVVATARMRFRNRVNIDKNNGHMSLDIELTDLTFTSSFVEMTVTAPIQPK